jgi:hypothetical protein
MQDIKKEKFSYISVKLLAGWGDWAGDRTLKACKLCILFYSTSAKTKKYQKGTQFRSLLRKGCIDK